MYSLFDPKSAWSINSMRPVYCGPQNPMMPQTPIMVATPVPGGGDQLFYSLYSPWVPHMSPAKPRSRAPSDDVFLPTTPLQTPRAFSYDFMRAPHGIAAPLSPSGNSDVANSVESHTEVSSLSGDEGSESSRSGVFDRMSPPRRPDFMYNHSNRSSPLSNIHESDLPSFCDIADIDETPFQPVNFTSAPRRQNFELGRGRVITKAQPEYCSDIYSNDVGMIENQHLMAQQRHREAEHECGKGKKRDEFLSILQVERERERRKIRPKFSPKLICKFCKNNGEAPEVYTKHRLQHDERTLCPLLRHYVCRLCGGTGDKAHTIRHCPLNNRGDRLAFEATYLLAR